MTGQVEDRLRDMFAERAASLPPPADPYERTRQAVRRSRRRRALTGSLTLCVLAAIAVPMAVFTPFRNPPLEDWPVRGSLAENSEFLEAARAEAVQSVELDGDGWTVDHSRIVYAGDRGEHRRVVAALSLRADRTRELTRPEGTLAPGPRDDGPDRGEPTVHLLLMMRGALGAEADDLYDRAGKPLYSGDSPYNNSPYGETGPITPHLAYVERGNDGGATVFAIGPPDTRAVAYSSRPRFHPDGTWDRSWREIPTRDGVAFGRLSEPPTGASLLRLHLPRDTVTVAPNGRYADADVAYPDDIASLPPDTARGQNPEGVMIAVSQVSAETGLSARFDARVVWRAEGERWRSMDSWLLAASFPNGVTFQAFWGKHGGHLALVPRGQGSRPLAVATHPFPFLPRAGGLPPPELWGAPRQRPRVLVVAPGNTDGYVQLRHRGETLATAPLDEKATADFGGQVTRRAAEAEAALRFRVFDRDGRETHRGIVHTQGVPRWNRTG